jgi:ABC-type proline/glycine betaine transport system permease subunit
VALVLGRLVVVMVAVAVAVVVAVAVEVELVVDVVALVTPTCPPFTVMGFALPLVGMLQLKRVTMTLGRICCLALLWPLRLCSRRPPTALIRLLLPTSVRLLLLLAHQLAP